MHVKSMFWDFLQKKSLVLRCFSRRWIFCFLSFYPKMSASSFSLSLVSESFFLNFLAEFSRFISVSYVEQP